MKVTWKQRLALAAAMAGLAVSAAAQCIKQSPSHTVALLELYTSEGCNSCPPADQWLGRVGRDGPGADQVVPLALHVDYWNRLGWRDRFASARYSERQGVLSGLGGSHVVYTPGVFLDLAEFRGWDSTVRLSDAMSAINARPAKADIRIELDSSSPGRFLVKAEFKLKPGVNPKRPQAYVALFENGLSTDVKGGENRGVTLRHDYVVREWIGPLDVLAPFEHAIALKPEWNAKNLGVAAFIQDLGNGTVLQATALTVCTKG